MKRFHNCTKTAATPNNTAEVVALLSKAYLHPAEHDRELHAQKADDTSTSSWITFKKRQPFSPFPINAQLLYHF